MIILRFGKTLAAENSGEKRDFSLPAQTKSDNWRKSLLNRMSQSAATLHVGSDDAGHRGLV